MDDRLSESVEKVQDIIDSMPDLSAKISALNYVRKRLHDNGPFRDEPVDCVLWVGVDEIEANDYNPNTVAPPEMELLCTSIEQDGYTQPIVTWAREDNVFEVVDGFHRNRVAREREAVAERIKGHLPITVTNSDRTERGDRIASTIRHNRARGKHGVTPMSDIVVELRRRNWSDKKIGKQLGMDPDEVLRLCQIMGLADMFSDRDFTEAWEAAEIFSENGQSNEDITDSLD